MAGVPEICHLGEKSATRTVDLIGPVPGCRVTRCPFSLQVIFKPGALARRHLQASATASMRIFFIRSSGANGLPFSIPMEAKRPRISGRGRFALHHAMQVFIELMVVGVDCVVDLF